MVREIQMAHGGEYIGEYFDNIKEGKGIFKWPNGRVFEGPFAQGNPHGVGLVTIDGKISEVEFINGKINKNFKKIKTGALAGNQLIKKDNQTGSFNNNSEVGPSPTKL